jgi:glycosyltransferase involved in cell wall biosynthesis
MIPTLSILIPTRNRPKELTSLVSIIKKCQTNRIEFIVSDNSDKVFEINNDPSIKLLRPKRILNMTDNWNFLLAHATGKYITFLGDDDAFIPTELLKLTSFANSCSSDIIWTNSAGYGWPFQGKVASFYQNMNNQLKLMDLAKMHKEILSLNHKIDLPVPYCRVIFHRRILTYFWNNHPNENFCAPRIPDISAAIKIAFISNSQVNYSRTVFISGASTASNGRLVRDGSSLGKKFEFNNLSFNPLPPGKLSKLKQAPPFGYITWYEAYTAALKQLNLYSDYPQWKSAFKSVFYSSNARLQKSISKQIWPESGFIISLAYILHKICYGKFNLIIVKFRSYFNLIRATLSSRRTVTIINGAGIADTYALIKFLEQSKILDSNQRVSKISVN